VIGKTVFLYPKMRKAKEEAGLKGERERRSKSSLNV
jgi:hypothetical protein